MMSQRNTSEPRDEQASSTYRSYEGEQQEARQYAESPYEQARRGAPREKVYLPLVDNANMFRLLVFVIAMVALLAFALVCLVFVGGTGGWISFCAASFAIFVMTSTFLGVIGPKREI